VTYLADVNVVSEPTKSRPDERVVQWLEEHETVTMVDPIVMGEIWRGILMLPEGRKREGLRTWFDRLRRNIPCAVWTMETALVWAEICDFIQRNGFTIAAPDTMIAATAKLNGWTVATRNVDDFKRCGVEVVNPFE
jgi:predicted nucleic acid-binding protein